MAVRVTRKKRDPVPTLATLAARFVVAARGTKLDGRVVWPLTDMMTARTEDARRRAAVDFLVATEKMQLQAIAVIREQVQSYVDGGTA